MRLWLAWYGSIERLKADESLRLYTVLLAAEGYGLQDQARSDLLRAWRRVARWGEYAERVLEPLGTQFGRVFGMIASAFGAETIQKK